MEMEKTTDPTSFHGAYRMTPATFDELLALVGPHIVKQTTNFRDPVGVSERLGITLRYLATDMSQRDVARHFCVGRATVCKIIQEVCQAIWEVGAPLFMAKPTTEDWKKIAEEFNNQWNFPHCLGAVDGKHIHIQKPALSGSLYFNYKRTFSTILMGVADAAYRFIYLDVGSYGREHDGSVFAQSTFGKALEDGTLLLPQSPNGDLPYVFVGDEAFPLKPQLMRPYPGKNLSDKKKIFNYRLSRARRVVENAFGIMVSKWRILRQPIIAKPEKVDKIVKAIGVLHNFMREKEGLEVECDVGSESGMTDVQIRLGANMYSGAAWDIRENFANHFSSPQGSLPYQNDIVQRGLNI
ncbi:Protein ALP1-like [Chionoecetes opilio]|uniref:Protein ALP1-like n=1 Tax=Chionoecetes opilio TaxID=41210 RepID=A0A8J5CJX5_CHIOP|nr:Protein ALP1-like [Chionoecetes opilio]